ncbi:hypothetical protein ACNKHR_11975 [Shigella flexneri]
MTTSQSTAGAGAGENIQRFLNDFPGAELSVWSRTTALPAIF